MFCFQSDQVPDEFGRLWQSRRDLLSVDLGWFSRDPIVYPSLVRHERERKPTLRVALGQFKRNSEKRHVCLMAVLYSGTFG